MVEGARLESVYTGNRIEGSNPSLSASQANRPERAVLVWWDEGNLFPIGPPTTKVGIADDSRGVMLGPPSGMSERSEDNPQRGNERNREINRPGTKFRHGL